MTLTELAGKTNTDRSAVQRITLSSDIRLLAAAPEYAGIFAAEEAVYLQRGCARFSFLICEFIYCATSNVKAGATMVFPSALAASMQLSALVWHAVGMKPDTAFCTVYDKSDYRISLLYDKG